MAISDSKLFSAVPLEAGDGDYNNTTDVFKWVLITEGYDSIDSASVDPTLSDFTQVTSSGNYVANSTIANTTWTRTGAITTLTGDSWSYAADGANPTTAKSLLIYNDTSADKSAYCVVDLTVDGGVTPADTTQGLTYTVNANGIYRVTNTTP